MEVPRASGRWPESGDGFFVAAAPLSFEDLLGSPKFEMAEMSELDGSPARPRRTQVARRARPYRGGSAQIGRHGPSTREEGSNRRGSDLVHERQSLRNQARPPLPSPEGKDPWGFYAIRGLTRGQLTRL